MFPHSLKSIWPNLNPEFNICSLKFYSTDGKVLKPPHLPPPNRQPTRPAWAGLQVLTHIHIHSPKSPHALRRRNRTTVAQVHLRRGTFLSNTAFWFHLAATSTWQRLFEPTFPQWLRCAAVACPLLLTSPHGLHFSWLLSNTQLYPPVNRPPQPCG